MDRQERYHHEHAEKQLSFDTSPMREVAQALAVSGIQYSKTPLIDSSFSEIQIASLVAEVHTDDPYFSSLVVNQNPDEKTIADAAILTAAKALALSRKVNKAQDKASLVGFADKVFDSVGGILSRVAGKRGMQVASTIALLATACQPTINSPDIKVTPISTNIIENFVLDQTQKISFINKGGTTLSASLSNARCIPQGDVPGIFNFQNLEINSITNFASCSADLKVKGDSTNVGVLVAEEGAGLGEVFIVLGQGSPENNTTSSWGYVVPLQEGRLDVSKNDLPRMQAIKDITGNTTIYITSTDSKGKVTTLTYKQSNSPAQTETPAYVTNLTNILSEQPIDAIQSQVPTPKVEETDTPEPLNNWYLNRPKSPEHIIAKFTNNEKGYTEQIKNLIKDFENRFIEVANTTTSEVVTLKTKDFETLTILNYSEISVSPENISLAYQYFISEAILKKHYKYEGVSFQVRPVDTPDIVIAIIPSNLAIDAPHTEWSVNSQSPNIAYIPMWSEDKMTNVPKDIYPTSNDVTAWEIIVELCQATNFTQLTDDSVKPEEKYKLKMTTQEVYCNSRGLWFVLKQLGFGHAKALDFFQSNVTFPYGSQNLKPMFMDARSYNQIPVIGKLFLDQ